MKRRRPVPADVYALVENTPATVLLEGGGLHNPETGEEPWTQLFTAPLRICAAYDAAGLADLFAAIETAVDAGHCAAGFFTYECGRCFEPQAGLHPARAGLPLAWVALYERSYVFDHAAGRFIGEDPPGLAAFAGAGATPSAPHPVIETNFALSEAEYARRIAAIHEWIRAGDVYQLNFTAPLQVKVQGSAAALYAHLRACQPAEYGALLHWQAGRHILSFSPELFFRIDREGAARRITTRPMKGTAARGRTTREDRERAAWLRNDPKNRAENVMIVDLERNDLGRVARFGSVRVEKLFALERYPTLWQMTSTVTAELRPGVCLADIFRALFPCGSITGAPKVRAMQLLGQLEDAPRGVYTGAIGFFSPRTTVFNVAIRTLELNGRQGTMGIGSGIVLDSDPAAEYRECMLKARFLTGAAHALSTRFSLIETMLWNGSYPLLALHLDRLADSAEYFGFPCQRTAVEAALQAYAQQFTDSAPRKVRLLLDGEGALQITDELLPAARGAERIGRVRIARERTDTADPMFFHKTTHRPLYAQAFQAASRAGYDDVLFLNQRGEVTEGAISNIFIEKDGCWRTPPIECGVLPGVYRRHLLATHPEMEECLLYADDLRAADALYLANAVRGLRRIEIDWE